MRRLYETGLVIAHEEVGVEKEKQSKQNLIAFPTQEAIENIPILIDGGRPREGLDDLLKLADYVVCSAKFPKAWTEASTVPQALVSFYAFKVPSTEEVDIDSLLESLELRKNKSASVPTCISLYSGEYFRLSRGRPGFDPRQRRFFTVLHFLLFPFYTFSFSHWAVAGSGYKLEAALTKENGTSWTYEKGQKPAPKRFYFSPNEVHIGVNKTNTPKSNKQQYVASNFHIQYNQNYFQQTSKL
ncbi:hypothetical protein VNO77_13406 [Canavalia gladiata]|uniref:Uncharacterized protein n=1 Tax=Canavalia gladiata TaxID=3824 RepID=A0AAN9LXU9_CANGL